MTCFFLMKNIIMFEFFAVCVFLATNKSLLKLVDFFPHSKKICLFIYVHEVRRTLQNT